MRRVWKSSSTTGLNPECDSFVRQTTGAKLCHLPAWTGMVERVFGHEGVYLVAREEGRVAASCP